MRTSPRSPGANGKTAASVGVTVDDETGRVRIAAGGRELNSFEFIDHFRSPVSLADLLVF
jgi:hypothetical protein